MVKRGSELVGECVVAVAVADISATAGWWAAAQRTHWARSPAGSHSMVADPWVFGDSVGHTPACALYAGS